MDWLQAQVRPEILKLKPYESARTELADTSGMVALDANENPYTPYPETQNMLLTNRYPDPQPRALLSQLALLYQVSPDKIFVGRGMDEGIELLIRVFCIPYRDNIVTLTPTFSYYRVAATIAGVDTIAIPLKISASENFTFDVNQLITSCTDKTKIIFLCSPNNPTGNIINLKDIEYIAKRLPHIVVAIDEAYLEFSECKSAIALMDEYDNIVVMKTLSKAYACAGVRIGSIIAQTPVIALIQKVMAPYPLSNPCINLTMQVLSPIGLNVANSRIKILRQERARVYEALALLPQIKVYPSEANFLLIQVADANQLYTKLLSHGIVVRMRTKDIPNTIRITIGTPGENNLLLSALGVEQTKIKSLERIANVVRNTRETKIVVNVNLDNSQLIEIDTGIGFFDHMLEQLARHGDFGLQLITKGDTHIDYHHTVEDVAIVLGEAINRALGDKRGINRYGFVLPMDEACAFATLDLSGRGMLKYEANYITQIIGNFPVELVEHFFLSFATHLRASLHLKVDGNNSHHMVEALFKACAKVLNQAMSKNLLNMSNNIPSTKGIL